MRYPLTKLGRSTTSPVTLLFALAFMCMARQSPVVAEDVVLVKDINTNPRALDISGRCLAGSTPLLIADDGIRGTELWTGEGVSGTRLVKDINPGASGGFPNNHCATLGSSVIFAGNDGTNGNEVWISDGTTAGTVLLKDINAGSANSSPGKFITLGAKVLFTANDGTSGTELWATDGTAAGTAILKDISSGSGSSSPSTLIILDGTTAVFAASTTAEGTELWKTDGTTAGTQLVKDIRSGSSSSSPSDMTLLGSSLFFSASTAASGREPWISDGTTAGTVQLADLNSAATDGFYSGGTLAVVNSKVLFAGRNTTSGYELFSSDGTTGGTTILKDIESGSGHSFPRNFVKVGSRVVFSAESAATGREVYVSDGSSAGTSLVSELNSGTGDGTDLGNAATLLDGSKLIFTGSQISSSEQQLYSWDDSALTLLTDLFPGAEDVNPPSLSTATGAGIALDVPSPADSFPGPGYLLTDGSVTGTQVHPGVLSGYTESSAVIPMAELNSKLLFAASDGTHGMELWSTDGTDAGTTRLTDINPGLGSSVIPMAGFAVLNGKLLFVAADATNGAELWATDGTSAGTALLKDINSGSSGAFSANTNSPRRFYVIGSNVVFSAKTAAAGYELWKSDGTAAGTSLISDIYPGTNSSLPEGFLAGAVSSSSLGPTLFFVADDGSHGSELWATTTSVTGITADLVSGSAGSSPAYITPIPFAGGYFGVAFRACTSSTGCEVFLSTGGAPSVIDAISGSTGSNPESLTFVSASRLFYVGAVSGTGSELLKSDTPFSTASLVKDIVSGSGGSNIVGLTALNSTTVIFSACSAGSGQDCEPWVSDGTAAGTTLVKDINPGSGSSSFGYSGFKVLNGVAYSLALASDSLSSLTYYRSDGTSAGTYGLTSPGFEYFSTDSLPSPFTSALNTLFFPAASTSYGIELFKIGEDQCTSDPLKSIPGLCGCGVAEADDDGDGAVDCLEACPADPLKQAAGECGCGVEDLDANGNGVADCTDSQLPTITPSRPRIRFTKKRANVTLTERSGVTYEVKYATASRGTKLSRLRFKTKQVTSNTLALKLPSRGKMLVVKYRYLVSGTALASELSPIAKKSLS